MPLLCRCVSMAITGTSKLQFRLLSQKKNAGTQRQKLVGELNQTIYAYLLKHASTVSGRTLANTIRSLSDLQIRPEMLEKLLLQAAVELKQRPTAFNSQERCMLVGTFAAQRHHPGIIINESVNRVRHSALLKLYLHMHVTHAWCLYACSSCMIGVLLSSYFYSREKRQLVSKDSRARSEGRCIALSPIDDQPSLQLHYCGAFKMVPICPHTVLHSPYWPSRASRTYACSPYIFPHSSHQVELITRCSNAQPWQARSFLREHSVISYRTCCHIIISAAAVHKRSRRSFAIQCLPAASGTRALRHAHTGRDCPR